MAILFVVVSLAFWRALATDTELTVMSQVDYEDAMLCTKFGFARGTEKHESCKIDLLDLRRSDEDLIARTSIP